MMRIGIDADRLARMRAQAADLMPGTAIVQRATLTNDGEGGWAETWANAGTVACRLDAIDARTRTEVQAAREARQTFYLLTVPYDTTLLFSDRVSVGGVAYEVAEVHGADSWAVTKRARVARVD